MLVWDCIAAGQNKSPAPSADARQKKNPASVVGVENFISAIQAYALLYCRSYSLYLSLSVNSFMIWSCTWLHLRSSS